MTKIDICQRCGRRLVIRRRGFCACCINNLGRQLTPSLQRLTSVPETAPGNVGTELVPWGATIKLRSTDFLDFEPVR